MSPLDDKILGEVIEKIDQYLGGVHLESLCIFGNSHPK